MEFILVSQLKKGTKLGDDVTSRYGHVLFKKNQMIYDRELEILKAFLIKSVPVQLEKSEDPTVEQKSSSIELEPLSEFQDHYEKMFNLLKQVFNAASSSINVPVLEIREHLLRLIEHIDEYNILSFIPTNSRVEDTLYHNSIMVSLTSYNLAVWLGQPQKDLIPVALGGLLHDIGNVKLDQTILRKPTKLTPEERSEMREHTTMGYNILKNVAGINEGVKLTALQHHEREDGSGYPMKLKSQFIHMYSKIVAVADIFHAMTSTRYYKKADSPYLVLEELLQESFGKLDPVIVQTFIRKVTQFHNGKWVRLNNNSIGEIVFTDRTHPTRPWVNVDGNIINLSLDRSYHIVEVMNH